MNTQTAIEEFLAGCNNPQGPVYKAAYRSFTRGQVEMHAYAMRHGIHCNVDPRIFVDAFNKDRAERLLSISAKAANILDANWKTCAIINT